MSLMFSAASFSVFQWLSLNSSSYGGYCHAFGHDVLLVLLVGLAKSSEPQGANFSQISDKNICIYASVH